MLDAADLAGLKVLALVNDGTAGMSYLIDRFHINLTCITAAVNYAMTRMFPQAPEAPEHHLFYDAGASAVRATIVSFQTIQVKDHPSSKITKNATQLDVKAVGWAKNVGGLILDGKIRDLLEKQFNASGGPSLETNSRAKAKLLKEAGRVKQVLSANYEAQSRVRARLASMNSRG